MKRFILRITRLIAGLSLFAFGIACTITANIGYAPWDVFHSGAANILGIRIGTASIAVSFTIVLICILLKEKLGLGTVLNMVLVGLILDFILFLNIIPAFEIMALQVLLLFAGLFIIAGASCLYLSSAFGGGPRDSLMVAVTRKTKLPIGVCRTVIELMALGMGWLLGGMVGVGTVLSAFGMGACIQIIFRLFKFKSTEVVHETAAQTFKVLLGMIRAQKMPR
ncbi:MAG: hypothetical protein FWE91_09335 [Defluviitaleaceae bacterium]|nr:hypothetical protein [Defluviitaleaceae bacterium]MCL2835746.1 hypothetical protein [Defluviitaleaceae bacterium]